MYVTYIANLERAYQGNTLEIEAMWEESNHIVPFSTTLSGQSVRAHPQSPLAASRAATSCRFLRHTGISFLSRPCVLRGDEYILTVSSFVEGTR